MSLSRYVRCLFAASVIMAGCEDPASTDPNLEQYRAQLTTNGFVVNGFVVNGFVVNGFVVNGFVVNGFVVNGFVVNGPGTTAPLPGITLTDLNLNGVNLSGQSAPVVDINGSLVSISVPGTKKVYSGTALKGLTAKVTIPGANGSTSVYLRLDDVYLDPQSKFKDVWLYRISSRAENSSTWQSTCRDYEGKPAALVPVKGSYWDEKGNRTDDSKAITLACVDGAIGKCVEAGYRPWATASLCTGWRSYQRCTDVSLKDHHQACTRMIRADYCGDGTPHTVNGTLLDIFDYLNPPVQLQEEKWQMEARWQPAGATCLSQQRHPEISFPGCLRQLDPKKPASYVQLPKCQPYASVSDRGLIVSTFNSMTNPPK